MPDFVSSFWNWFIIVPTVAGIIGLFILIRWLSEKPRAHGEAIETMGHVWDGDLAEFNHPLPRWWLNLFYITLFFAIGYAVLYPGLGTFAGTLGWTSRGQYESEMAAADSEYGPLYARWQSQDLMTVSQDPQARKTGRRLFMNYCAQCHGADAGGSRGFPSLRDGEWLYGSDPAAIETSILDGRLAAMPPWGDTLGAQGVTDVANFVLQLANRSDADPAAAARGKTRFETLCVACHGADGKGMTALGAPDLTNGTWLYGGSLAQVSESIAKGRKGQMPAHRGTLGEAKAHLLAAYVLGLNQ